MAGDDEISPSEQGDAVSGVALACPMNCCLATHGGKQATIASRALIAPRHAVLDKEPFFVIAFIAPGFSSHTDRGPPIL